MNGRRTQLLILLLASVLLRLVMHLTYLPWWAGDSAGYALPAWAIFTGHFAAWDGGRTPGYPIFLGICELLAGGGVNFKLTPLAGQIVAWAQSLMGIATVFLLYFTMERLQIRSWIRFVLALFYALLATVAEFEMMILSDLLCLFFTTLAVSLMSLTTECLRCGRPVSMPALMTGIASGAAIWVRPNALLIWAVFIATLIGLAFLRARGREAATIFKACGICAACGAYFVVAWLIFNYENTTDFTMSPIIGAERTVPAYNLFDRVHPEDKVLGEIMVKYYHQTNDARHSDLNYWNVAYPEIEHRYNEMPLPQNPGLHITIRISQYLLHVSNYLLAEHPGVWLQNSWAQFERTTDFQTPIPDPVIAGDPISLTGRSVVLSVPLWKFWIAFSNAQTWPQIATYFLTYVTVIVAAMRLFRARNLAESLGSLLPLALAVAALGSILTFCVLAEYCYRYSLPLLPIFIICTAYVIESCCLAVTAYRARVDRIPA